MGQEDRDWFRERKIDYLNGGLLPAGKKSSFETFLSRSEQSSGNSFLKFLVVFGVVGILFLLYLVLKYLLNYF